MKRTLKQVRPEDFDEKLLLAAAREGKLYLDCSMPTADKQAVVEGVRVYVKRIQTLATEKYISSVDAVWEAILSDDDFVAYLTPGPKSRKCRVFNKYAVMRIIGVLREHEVYECRPDRQFDSILEPEMKDSPYRRYLGVGIKERPLLLKIRRILAKLKL